MITPASIADWTMLAGLMALVSGFAALGHGRIFEEAEPEPVVVASETVTRRRAA